MTAAFTFAGRGGSVNGRLAITNNAARYDGGGVYIQLAQSYGLDAYVPANAAAYGNLVLAGGSSFGGNAAGKGPVWRDIND